MSGGRTKKVSEMRDDYDFSAGERGKYAALYRERSNVVVLDPDVARDFPDSTSVNEALREVRELRRLGGESSAKS